MFSRERGWLRASKWDWQWLAGSRAQPRNGHQVFPVRGERTQWCQTATPERATGSCVGDLAIFWASEVRLLDVASGKLSCMDQWPAGGTDLAKLPDVTRRQLAITQQVHESGLKRVSELAEMFGVSEMSIRRDAIALQEEGLIRRVPGALLPPNDLGGDDFPRRSREHTAAKQIVARRGLELVGKHDVLAIDAGSTCLQLVNSLPDDFSGTVISHSLPVLNALADLDRITTIGLGGEHFVRSRAFVGSLTVSAARELRATTFFMGAAAIGPDGVFASWDVEKDVKRTLAEVSQRVVVLGDHTKFEVAAPVFLMGWNERMTVIADRVPDTMAEVLESSGAELILA